jgi:hypothetical protein
MIRISRTPRTPEEWVNFNKNLIKLHMTVTKTSYQQLSAALRRLGIDEEPRNLANRVWNGRFSAIFLLQCLRAMNVETLHLPVDDIPEPPVVRPRRRRPDLVKGHARKMQKG